MKKKGSHVGFILSFVIFVTSVFFIYIILEPSFETDDYSLLLDNLEAKIIENVTSQDFTSLAATISDASGGGGSSCIRIVGGSAQSELEDSEVINGLKILDSSDNVVDYDNDGGEILVEVSNGYTGLMKFFYGEGVERSQDYGGSQDCNNVDADAEQIITENQITSGKIKALINDYENDYLFVKDSLDVPQNNEFAFNFTYSNETSIGTEWPQAQTNIFIKDYSVVYFEDDLEVGILKVGIW